MSDRRQEQQGASPFHAGDRVLFSLTFNVDTGDFNEFIERVTRELCNRIQPRWYYGSAMVLPCPRARRTWFVIVLESRDREMHYSVRFFIEAENIYLRGYQNQVGDRFEFQPDNDMPQRPYLVRSTFLSFGCNYTSLVRATRHQVQAGQQGDPGLTLNIEEDERRRPNFGQERLRAAVRELAQAANAAGSHHRTAQNLLLVIIRFCESIRYRSVRREMVDLWTVPNRSSATRLSFPQPSRSLSGAAILQIQNWGGISSALMNHIHGRPGPSGSGPLAPTIWPSDSARTMGVANAAEAQRIIVLVLFNGDPNQPHGTPEWGDAAPDNN